MEGGLWVSNEREVFFLVGPPNGALIEGLEVPETPGPQVCALETSFSPQTCPKANGSQRPA